MKIIFKRNANDREMWDMITEVKSQGKRTVWATIHEDFLPGTYEDRLDTNEVVLIAGVDDD